MKTKDLLKTKLSSLAGPPLRQPRPLDERLRPARRQPDDHDDRDGRQSGIRLRRPQATVETFTQLPDYTVTFQADGATVKTMTVEDGYTLKDSDYPAVPGKTGYTGEWVKYTSAVHSNVTVQAKYTAVVAKYTVTFKADNTVVKTMTVKDGYTLKASDYPTVPAKSGYKGSWKRYTAAIHSDITIDAVYEPVIVTKQYTVVFRADAKVLKTMKVEVGYTLQDSDYPEIPAKEGYTGHWDKSTTRIIKNTIINVIYSDNSSHVVTFIFDGAQIGTLTVTDGYVLKNSDYPSPFAPVGYIVTWEKYTLPIHSDITVTGKLQSDVTIPPQPTGPGEIMSGGEGEPVEADVPAKDETVSPQGTHVTGKQTVTHEYLTLNGKVARETIRTNNTLTAVLDFIYDESGKPFALKYSTNGTSFQTYYYVLNLQGDVVKLIHYIPGFEYESVATYEYDAWGNIVSSSGRLAEINPLRYRGYYYDSGTGFYYLQSRYYDPANRRFINADIYASTDSNNALACNMYSYCWNNVVILYDSEGELPKIVTVLDVQTHATGTDNDSGAIFFATTITYTETFTVNSFFWTVYESSSTYTNSYEFKLTPNGVLQFDNTQVNANDLLKSQISECIASEMLRVSREVYPDALSNRSVRGIANELVVHYLLSDIVERAKVADMGDTKKTARGYDRNAWIFEALN